ncbi:hypothetical protein PV646_04800 [Streptomyces sp. ID05-26A]|nr:hypothetical protein [Streptomyces sp. ID05-26A]
MALNVADPIVAGEYGKAAFDAVGPLMLIGWAEVGPGVLYAIKAAAPSITAGGIGGDHRHLQKEEFAELGAQMNEAECLAPEAKQSRERTAHGYPIEAYLDRARVEDKAHRAAHQKPISAENLRARLRIGAAPARQLVKIVRDEFDGQMCGRLTEADALHSDVKNLQLSQRERV